MAQGIVKSYDPNSGSGIVLLDTDQTRFIKRFDIYNIKTRPKNQF